MEKKEIIKKIKIGFFVISLIVLIISFFMLLNIGWKPNLKSFWMWSIIGFISLAGVKLSKKHLF